MDTLLSKDIEDVVATDELKVYDTFEEMKLRESSGANPRDCTCIVSMRNWNQENRQARSHRERNYIGVTRKWT